MALTKAKLVEIIKSGALDSAIFLRQHPVGRIVFSADNVNPGTIYGGTWVAWGAGRVPVGVNPSDADFDAAEKTGGAKTHTLTVAQIPYHNHGVLVDGQGGATTYGVDVIASGANSNFNLMYGGYTGGGASHNNLQPYETCYMWKRTA